jgi:hypothetical protein
MKFLEKIKLNYEAYKIFCQVRRILKEEQEFEYEKFGKCIENGYLYDLLIVQETALKMVRPKIDKDKYCFLYKGWIRKNL